MGSSLVRTSDWTHGDGKGSERLCEAVGEVELRLVVVPEPSGLDAGFAARPRNVIASKIATRLMAMAPSAIPARARLATLAGRLNHGRLAGTPDAGPGPVAVKSATGSA